MILFIQFYWSEKSFCIVAYLNFSHFSVAKNPDKCRLLNFNEWQVHEPYLSPKDIELIQHQYGRFCTLVWKYFWKSMHKYSYLCILRFQKEILQYNHHIVIDIYLSLEKKCINIEVTLQNIYYPIALCFVMKNVY